MRIQFGIFSQKGYIYPGFRLVLDLKEYYYLAAEYHYCKACKGTYIAWDYRLLGNFQTVCDSRFQLFLLINMPVTRQLFRFFVRGHLEIPLVLCRTASVNCTAKNG